MTVNGGELLVRTLKQAEVTDAFVLHGGHLDPIFQACLDHGIALVDTRHEAAAGHAADAYARQTGRLGVAIATAGPGYTNALTAITHAYLDCSPVLFIVGAAPLRDAERSPLQGGVDQVAMAAPVTKWSGQVTRTEQIPHLVAHAIRIATTGRPGPVLVEVPIDVLFNAIDDDCPIPEAIIPDTAPAPSEDQIAAVFDELQKAKRPVIVAGGGVLFAGAGDELVRFAEATGVPVYANSRALGALPTDHSLSGHSIANLGLLRVSGGGEPDLAIFLGARFGWFTRGEKILPSECRLVQVDIDAQELGKQRPVHVPVNADCRETLRAFNAQAAARTWPDWGEWSRHVHNASRWHVDAYRDVDSSAATVHPYRALVEVMAALDEDTIVCADGGEASQWAELVTRSNRAGQFTSHGYLGCLGIGMPFAIGSQVAHPNRRVVCIVGDGAAGLNVQEFDTMVRHNLPVVTVVLNNKAWGMCLHGQQSMYGNNRLVVTTLGDGRYEQVAEAFGGYGAYVEDVADVRDAVKAALASNRPACINIITDIDAAFGSEQPAPKKAKEIEMPYYENLEQK